MKREHSNRIRWFMEDVVPPVVRDTRLFAWLMQRVYGRLVDDLADFRRTAHALTPQEYSDMYRRMPRVHDDTDNSAAILQQIAGHVIQGEVVDIGCGTGYTLGWLARKLGTEKYSYTGVDFQIADAVRTDHPDVTFLEYDIAALPFPDKSFDTVICTHTLEHILDVRAAIAELRRICRKRLIVVVPLEREGLYTFNPHFHFFPYTHSFLRIMIPLPQHFACEDVQRDIFYFEDRE